MIILRQKTYTRAEREALKELLLKTRGFRRLPKGSKLNARDVNRFNEFAGDLQAYIKGFKPEKKDFENARTFLEHADLGKLSKELEHMAKKYSNKRVLSRWQKIKNRDPFATLKDRIKEQPVKKKLIKAADKDWINSEHLSDIKGKIRRGEGGLMKSLVNEAKKNNIPVIHSHTGTSRINSNLKNVRNLNENGVETIENKIYNDYPRKNFSKKQAKRLDSAINNRDVDNIITLGRSAGPGALAHEFGHYKTDKSLTGRYLKATSNAENRSARTLVHHHGGNNISRLHRKALVMGNSLNTVANESSATSHGLARLKKHGATPEQLERVKEELGANGALGTYINHGKIEYAKTLGF